MKQNEIIEMARQTLSKDIDGLWLAGTPDLEAFAKLVADVATAKEREACAKIVEKIETYEKIEKACFKFAAKTIRARGEPTSRGEA